MALREVFVWRWVEEVEKGRRAGMETGNSPRHLVDVRRQVRVRQAGGPWAMAAEGSSHLHLHLG